MLSRILGCSLVAMATMLATFGSLAAEPSSEPNVAVQAALDLLSPTASRLIAGAQESNAPYQRLAELCDTFGPRITGSTNLELAIDWILTALRSDEFANVRGEPVLVPHWVRGMKAPRRGEAARCGGCA